MSVIFSPLAEADIEGIWSYTAQRWGDAQAEIYLRKLHSALESLSSKPKSGLACDEIRAGYRKLAVGSHVVFYRLENHDVKIVRILHQRMDIDEHFAGD
jgi:toxin ParE1/3/4